MDELELAAEAMERWLEDRIGVEDFRPQVIAEVNRRGKWRQVAIQRLPSDYPRLEWRRGG